MADHPLTEGADNTTSFRKRWRARYGRSGVALLVFVCLLGIACAAHVIGKLDDMEKMRELLSKFTHQATGGAEAGVMPLKAREYGFVGVWLGCIAGAVICVLLAICAKIWVPGGEIKTRRAPFLPPLPGLLPTLFLTISLVIALWYRAPRMGQSFWNDEEYSLRRYTHGAWEQGKDGAWKFDPVKWEATLYDSRNGNNHLLNSALSRVSLDAWRFVKGESEDVFSEIAARLPALIAGALTLVLVFALGVEMGSGWLGACAAALLAFHPWHVRYAAEERGYSLMIFFISLALVGLVRAFRNNKVSAWLCFAIGQAGCLLSFAASIYAVLGINLIAMMELLARKEWRRLGPLIGFNMLAAIPVMIWTLPSAPQILAVFAHDHDTLRLGVGWEWLRDFLSHLLVGVHYNIAEPELHHGTSWVLQTQGSFLFKVFIGGVFAFLALAGLVTAMFRNSATRLAIVGPVLGAVIVFTENALKDGPLLIWYLLYLLVPLVLAAPLIVGWLVQTRERILPPVLIVLTALYAAASSDVRGRIVQYDRQPMRQAVQFIRESTPEAMTVVFGVSDRQTQSYDPRVRILEQEADLDKAIADAASEGRPLYVYFCGRTDSGRRNADLMKRVLDEAAFEKVADFPGLEAMFSYEVWKLRK